MDLYVFTDDADKLGRFSVMISSKEGIGIVLLNK
jgi:hypothetical protein